MHIGRAVAAGTAVSIAFALGACGGKASDTPAATATRSTAAASPTPSAEPKTVDAAKAAAQREFDLYAAGDWAGAWDLWTKAGKAAFSRSDYSRLHTECKTLTGLTFEITNARLENDTTAVVAYKRSIAAGTANMMYEDGGWRYQPDASSMADYAKGVDKLIADSKQEGRCGD
ncbi:hypothetical protein HC031_05285 [Planosporangium thailandense]|uniref:Lipoprotein n=1 Tax=Planosporangium thailandense TaxID=765197 RepID=A0ABX0XT25_9ACTN|nr:hypothetical protein [Planosporangium thailandense]NJC69133.1 hypothetical protein [Planosporangium thailandense]